MTEDQAIERIYNAIIEEFGIQFDEGYDEPTVRRMSTAAWSEIKAIAREDARKQYVDEHFCGVDPETCAEWKQELIDGAAYLDEHGSFPEA